MEKKPIALSQLPSDLMYRIAESVKANKEKAQKGKKESA